MKKKLSLVMIALMAVAAFAATMSVTMSRRAVTELTVISETTTWDFSKLTANTSSEYYASEGIKLTDESTPTKNDEFIYANYLTTFFTADASFKADAIAFKGEYPIRKNQYAQNGTLHFKTSVAGKIVVSFNDTGSSASTTAVKRYLIVNGTQTEYWTSRENNGTEAPYEAKLKVTSGEIEVPAGDVTITGSSAIQVSKIVFTPDGETPSTPTAIVYDFAAEQALIAAGTVEKPGNVGGNQNNGQGFNAYSVKIRNDYKGYSKKEGSTLPETCNIWRRVDRFDQDASWNVAGGVAMPNDREFAIDGLTPGSKVVIEYDATNAAEGSKDIIWAVGENNTLGEAVGAGEGIPVATATIGGVEAVPGETAIASGAEILVKSVTPAVKGTGYIVIKVKKNMVISKISILVNEDAVSNAVTVADGIENGTVKVNRTTAFEGDDVYVTATPAEGYGLEAITVKDADGADVTVTDGKFTMPAKAVTVSATFKDKRIVYDFAAEQALIAAGTVEKPGNVGGNQNNGQGFNAYSVKIRNDYKGYSKKEGSTLPETCNIWRRVDRFDQDASWNVAGGVAMPNDREFAIDGLTPGSKVVIEYDATNAAEGSKDIIWAVGENNTLGEAVGAGEGIPVATATIGGVEAVPGETAIASGAEILVKSVTPAVKGTGYIVIKVKKNMVISKISILVNEDAVSNAVTVADGIENGTVKVNRTTAFEGDDVYVTATPAEGYGLEAITVKDADGADVTVTDGKFTMPAKAVTVSATFKDKRIVYDFAAEQALIAAGTVEKPGNVGGNQNNGQGFNAYSVKIRNDYKGYSKKEGSTLPETCNIWRRVDRFDQDASWNVAGGVAMPNDREFAIDGLTPGSKVVIEYDATNAAEGSKDIIWAVGENNTLGEAVGAGEGIPVATATIGGVEAVPGETAIASGAEILVKSVTPAVKGTGYIVIKVKKNMVISKISILVNEDAVSNAVTVADGIENGTVKVNRTTAFEGDDVYVTATPAEGYGLEAITVKDADGADVTVTDGKFTMPAKAVTVSATFVAIPKFYIFGDVTETGWNAVTTEMTFNVEAQAYEYEFEATKDVWFAFSDTEFAVTDGNWEAVNAARYSLGGTEPTIGTAQDLVKGVDSSIKLSAGTWKVSVSADMKTLTITGEAAPEPTEATYVVAGAPASLFGTEWSGNAEANKMTKNTETGLYELKFTGVAFTAATTIEYKIVKNSSIWIPDGVGNNQTVSIPAAGTYDITFTFNPEGSVITGVATVATGIGIINVDGVNDIFSDGKPVYNLSGQRVFKGYKGVVIKNGKKIVVK